jgi:predicted dehydrogenase
VGAELIRVGIVGAGANAKKLHIPNLQAIPGVEVVSVCNRSRTSSEEVASEHGIGHVHDDWRNLIFDDLVDAVVVGTWPYMHAPVTLAALAAGKHVLCEARLALTASEARRMRDEARRRPELVVQVVPAPLTLPFDKTVRRFIDDGYLGQLLVVDARSGGGFIQPASPLSWRHDFDLSGFNTLFLGSLYEYVMRWVGEAIGVRAATRTFVSTRRNTAGRLVAVRIPDHVDVIADMACGAQARLQASAVTGLRAGTEICLFGSEGTLRFADGELTAGRRGDASLSSVQIHPEDEGRWRVEEEFIGAIRGEEAVTLTTFDDGVRYMDFTEAVARSAASGRAVSLPM